MVDLDVLSALASRATPGPWETKPLPNDDPEERDYCHVTAESVDIDEALALFVPEADAALIVAAINALPALIAELRDLRAALTVERLTDILHPLHEPYVDPGLVFRMDDCEDLAAALLAALLRKEET
jgi:hypothetical protein